MTFPIFKTASPTLPTSQPELQPTAPADPPILGRRLRQAFSNGYKPAHIHVTSPPFYICIFLTIIVPVIYQIIILHWSFTIIFMLAIQILADWLQRRHTSRAIAKGKDVLPHFGMKLSFLVVFLVCLGAFPVWTSRGAEREIWQAMLSHALSTESACVVHYKLIWDLWYIEGGYDERTGGLVRGTESEISDCCVVSILARR
ncbi:unnamed protein product [Periconia digitata]|uniref:Uncharacterized protein n=1 Tax=Periconia digitata TaxID=1303443 RepID=A0A9W4URL7_9PLEO|nr:unnamed protein product [Periconia digitata]